MTTIPSITGVLPVLQYPVRADGGLDVTGAVTGPGDCQPLITVKVIAARIGLALLAGVTVLACGGEARAATRVLVLGSSQSYLSEAAFPTAGVAGNLQGILEGDASVSQPVTVQNTDTYKSDATTGFSARTLMSWFYWPDTHAATLALLANNWNYVVMVDDPYVASTFPEYHLEGVMRISQEARKIGAQPISVMTWSSGSTAVSKFGEMAYRVGDGAGVSVAPAGYAWNNLSTELKDTGTRPTARGAYVTAATVFSRIFNRSAKLSSFVPAGMTVADRDALADVALLTVQAEAAKTQYSGTVRRPTHFATPLVKNRSVRYADWNSSTEDGISGRFSTCFSNLRTSVSQPYSSGYQSFPTVPEVIDFCHSRFYDYADPTQWRNYGTFDFQDKNGARSMVVGMDRVMWPNGFPEQPTGAVNVGDYFMNRGTFFVPIRVLWARIQEAQPQIPFQSDGHHMSSPVLNGVAAMMVTLLTGRCPTGDEPADPTSTAWQEWFCRKTGYEVAVQHATLNARMAGFLVLPSATTATTLSEGTNEIMPVRFRYAPTADVTVKVTADQPGAVVITPATLTFTPANYATAQNVVVKLASGARPVGPVTLRFDSQSSDRVFDQLNDEWTYTPVPSFRWDAGGSDSNWGTAANWNPDGAPVDGGYGVLTFASSNKLSNTNNLTGLIANSITFDSAAGAFILGGNAVTLNGNIGFSANPAIAVSHAINLNLILNSNRTISSQTNGSLVFGGIISESGTNRILTKSGNGAVTLAGTNTFSGQLAIIAGTVKVPTIKASGVASSVGKSATAPQLRIGSGSAAAGLVYTGIGDTTDRAIQIGNNSATPAATDTGGATIQADGTGPLVFNGSSFNIAQSGVIASTARLLTLQGSNTGANTIAGVIRNNSVGASGTGAVALTKAGSGTWVLSGTCTYTGPTTVNAGRLVLAGMLASDIAANGGTLAPNGMPTTTGNVSIGSASHFEVRINGPVAGTQYDQLSAGGTVSLGGTLDIVAAPGLPPGTSFVILNKTSAGAVSSTFAGKPNGSAFTVGGYVWLINYNWGDGNDVVLSTATAQQSWRFIHFGSIANTGNAADTFDSNGDGEVNLLEFATGQNPNAAGIAVTTIVFNGSGFDFIYTRSKVAQAGGLAFAVVWSDTLAPGSWSTSGVSSETVLSDNGTTQQVQVTVPASGVGRRFVRLEVTSP